MHIVNFTLRASGQPCGLVELDRVNMMLRSFVLSLALAAIPAASGPAEQVGPHHMTRIEIRRVNLHPDDAVAVYVEDLTGTLLPKHAGLPSNLDDKYSYDIAIDSAEITISAAALTLL